MGQRKKKSTKRADTHPPGEAGDRAARRGRIDRRKGKGAHAKRDSWLAGKRPVLRFVVIFGVCMGGFYAFTITTFFEQKAWVPYLGLNAEVSAQILRIFGHDATVSGQTLSSPQTSLVIARGCDAIHPSALFVSAVLASPVSVWAKLPGMAIGTLFLMLTNLTRIITLYYVQIHFPRAFEIMHVEVWQTLFIFLAILCWVLWAWWAVGVRDGPRHASA